MTTFFQRFSVAAVFGCSIAVPVWCGEEAKAITNSLGMKLVCLEPGSFIMGQDGPAADYNVKAHAAKFDGADWDERPAHRVNISGAFHIGARR